jgi:hypothetical protein
MKTSDTFLKKFFYTSLLETDILVSSDTVSLFTKIQVDTADAYIRLPQTDLSPQQIDSHHEVFSFQLFILWCYHGITACPRNNQHLLGIFLDNRP